MGFIPGKLMRVSYDGKPLWHATECSLQIDRDTEDIATKDTDGKQFTNGDYAWTMSTNALYATQETGVTTHVTSDDMFGLLLTGDFLDVEFTTGDVGSVLYSGQVGITSGSLTATTGSTGTTTFSFKGNGTLVKGVVPA